MFVDREAEVIEALRVHLKTLHAPSGDLVRADAMRYLAGPSSQFDLVFLDPPFDSALLESVLARLLTGAWLAPGARVYLECAAGRVPELPAGWVMLRQARAGKVEFGLAAAGESPSA